MTRTKTELLLEQWKTDKYAARLVVRSIYYVIDDNVYRLTCEYGTSVYTYPEEALFSSQEKSDTRIVLYCLNINTSLPESGSIIVRSPDTDVLVLLTKYCKDIKCRILSLA